MAAELMLDALGEVGRGQAREAALLHFVGRMSAQDAAAVRAALERDEQA
jgi:hypothetical protein